MKAPTWHRLRLRLFNVVCTLLIALAAVMGLAQLALPWLAAHPRHVENWLSQRVGRAVSIGQLSAEWTRGGPRLILDNVHISADGSAAALELPRAELSLDIHAALQRNRSVSEFRVVGLEVRLLRGADGRWQMQGVAESSGEVSMGALGALVLADVKLLISDPAHDIALDLHIPELRVINRGRVMRVQGHVGYADAATPPLLLVADLDLAGHSGQLYAAGDQIDLARAFSPHAPGGIDVSAGQGDVRLWAWWQQGQLNDVRLQLATHDIVLAAHAPLGQPTETAAPNVQLQRADLAARWKLDARGWTLDVADARLTHKDIGYPPMRLSMSTTTGTDARTHVAVNALPLEPFASVAALSDRLPEALRRWLYQGNPRGSVAAAELDFASAEDFNVDAVLAGVGVDSVVTIPGVEHIDARVRGDASSLLLELPQQPLRINYAHVFRKPLLFSAFAGELLAWREDGAWNVQTPSLHFLGEGYQGDLLGGVRIPTGEGSPLLDVSARVTDAEVIAAKLFWPVNVMPPPAVKWLDDALLGGRVVGGRVAFRGELAHWPFDDLSGRFEARAEIEDLQLAYLADWPHGEHLDLVANFINDGMQVELHAGKAMQLEIDSASARVADFGDAVLELAVASHGSGSAMLDFLRATPIGKAYADYLTTLKIGGSGKIAFKLDVPLAEHEKLALDGSIDLLGSDLDESAWDIHLAQAKGQVNFSQNGVSAPELAVQMDGHPARLALAIGSAAQDSANALEVRLRGVLPVSSVFAGMPEIAPALERFQGMADWTVAVDVGSAEGNKAGRKSARLSSDLRGLAIDLPAPLRKEAEDAWPFQLMLDVPQAGQPFSARLGDILSVRGRLPDGRKPFAARLDFGAQPSTGVVPVQGVSVNGQVAELDVGGWMELGAGVGAGASADGDLLQGLDLQVDDLRLSGGHFGSVELEVSADADAHVVSFTGAALDGEVRIPAKDLDRRGITARLARLHWPSAPAQTQAQESGLSMSGIAPASIPPLHVWIGDLRFGSADLGEVRLESYPGADAMRIDQLDAKSPSLDMHASGEWKGVAGQDRSHFQVDLSSPSIGRMLDAFGFAGVIDGGQTLAQLDAQWPGTPAAFDLAQVTGSLHVSIEKGRILDVDPGAGRLFGLLSLQEIPRRLALDFSDLFRAGMTFNAITGQFSLRDGNAWTDDLRITSPAADISISGRTGLRARDYDQQMVVTPHAGVTLPVVGALAAGPVGAAAGLVVQGLLNKQISQATRSYYRVSGSWDKPDISLQSREQARVPAAKIDVRKPDGLPVPAEVPQESWLPLPAWLQPPQANPPLSPAQPQPPDPARAR